MILSVILLFKSSSLSFINDERPLHDMKLYVALFLVVLLAVFLTYLPAILAVDCPQASYGTGDFAINYYSSPLCITCYAQKSTLNELKTDDRLTITEYNADFCPQGRAIRGVPAFEVNGTVHYGLQEKETILSWVSA